MVVVEPGIYRHYKGEYYLVQGIAQHTERDEQLVLYVPLTGNEGRAGLRLRARPVYGKKGFLELEGNQPRFLYIGQEMPNTTGEVVG